MRDLQSGIRLLRTQRTFSVVAVLTLAVGIGLSTTLFTVIHAAVLRPFPISDPEQLVRIGVQEPRPGGEPRQYGASVNDIRQWRELPSVFSHTAVDRGDQPLVVDAGEPVRLDVRVVSEGYLELFDIRPIIGRAFSTDDAHEGSPAVALLGHGYWQSQFDGDRAVIGRTIRVANEPVTIIGVLPPGFYSTTALWQPLRYPPGFERMRGTGASAIGRLRPGVTMAAAQAELTNIVGRDIPGAEVRLQSMFDRTVSGAVSSARTLAGAVGAILLIACVNVAGLLLARGATRRRELAVRASLGASRVALIRQLLVESVVLAVAGGAMGVLLAWVSLDALLAIVPITVPGTAEATLNPQVLLFSGALAVGTVLIFGVLPAIRLSRVDVSSALSGAERHAGAALSRRSGQALIAAEVALAVIVLAGAGLMVRSFARLVSVDLGFDPSAFLTMEVAPVDPSPEAAAAFYPALLQAVRALPGVQVAGAGNQMPVGGMRMAAFIHAQGDAIRVDHRLVLPGYFEAAGMRLMDGRFLTDEDVRGGRLALVINESAARVLFPGQRAVGQTVPFDSQTFEIGGVVADVLQDGARLPSRPNVYTI
jgi:predicted permease